MTNFTRMRHIARNICGIVEQKDKDYGSSWRRRGGIGAYMMMARKWDRIEQFAQRSGYDIFKVLAENSGDVRDDVDDLIGYLLLIREHSVGEDSAPAPIPEKVVTVALVDEGNTETVQQADATAGLDLAQGQSLAGRVYPMPPSGDSKPTELELKLLRDFHEDEHWQCEGYYGDNTQLYRCRNCREMWRLKAKPAVPHCHPKKISHTPV